MMIQDSQYLDEMVKKIKKEIYIEGKPEKTFLLENKAINEAGEVLANYPKLMMINAKGETESIDKGGDLFQLKAEREHIQAQFGRNSWIEYVPRFWSMYMTAKGIIDRKISEMATGCPVCESKAWRKEENKWCDCVKSFLLR
jgi:hypothetical protein